MVLKGEERDSYGRLLYFYNRCDFKASSTTNFWGHYSNHYGIQIKLHGKDYRTAEVAKGLRSVFNNLRLKNHDLDNKILREAINKKVIKTALLNLIIVHNLSFQIV